MAVTDDDLNHISKEMDKVKNPEYIRPILIAPTKQVAKIWRKMYPNNKVFVSKKLPEK